MQKESQQLLLYLNDLDNSTFCVGDKLNKLLPCDNLYFADYEQKGFYRARKKFGHG